MRADVAAFRQDSSTPRWHLARESCWLPAVVGLLGGWLLTRAPVPPVLCIVGFSAFDLAGCPEAEGGSEVLGSDDRPFPAVPLPNPCCHDSGKASADVLCGGLAGEVETVAFANFSDAMWVRNGRLEKKVNYPSPGWHKALSRPAL